MQTSRSSWLIAVLAIGGGALALAQTTPQAQSQSADAQSAESQSAQPQSAETQGAETQTTEPQTPQPPPPMEPQSGGSQTAEPQTGDAQIPTPSTAEPQTPMPPGSEPQTAEPQTGEPQIPPPSTAEPQPPMPQGTEPQTPEPPMSSQDAQSKTTEPTAGTAEARAQRPNITILATGGTIAGAGESGYGYTSGQFKVDDLIKAVPNLDKLAKLSGEQIANIGSQDMNDAVWLKLAQRANQLLADPNVDGIVITHGTDTMEETAYFLNLAVKSSKPVVLVGSMRPATATSADGPANLYNGVAVAASPGAKGRGVLVVINDEVHNGRNVIKTNTTNVETFDSPLRGEAGLVHSGSVNWFEPMDKRHTSDSEFDVKGLDKLPRVDIVYAHSNMDATMINAAIAAGAKGIVVAGVGDGNMSKPALDALAKAAKKGIVVVRSTRLPTGMVMRNAEVDDDKLGFVASGELNPGKSRALTQLALTETRDPKRIQQMFNQY